MTNTNKLKGKLAERGLTQAQLAKMIEMSPTTLSFKLNNEIEFKISEAKRIQEALGLSRDERDAIFFGDDVENN